jgi:hypothetical protein
MLCNLQRQLSTGVSCIKSQINSWGTTHRCEEYMNNGFTIIFMSVLPCNKRVLYL